MRIPTSSWLKLTVLGIALVGIGCGVFGGLSRDSKFIEIAVAEDEAVLSENLLAYLRDADVEVRRRAVLAVGRVGDTMAATALAPLLADKDTLVRASAAIALGNIRHKTIQSDVFQALQREKNAFVIEHLLWSLGRLYVQEIADSLVPFLDYADARVRGQAALSLNLMAHQKAAGAVAELLDDPEPVARLRAATALSRLSPSGLGEKIVPCLADPDVDIAGAALIALGNTKDPAYYPYLLQALADPRRDIRLAAVTGIGAMRDTLLVRDVYPFLETEQDPGVLAQLVFALGWHWQGSVAPYFQRLQTHPDIGVRIKLPSALLRCLRQDSFEAIAGMADDPSWAVRAAVPKELESFNQPAWGHSGPAAEILRKLAADSVAAVRAVAVKSSMAFSGTLTDVTLGALEDPDELVRYYALNVLPFAGGRVTFDSLLAWYRAQQDSPRPEVRMAILALTGNLSPSVQIGPVQREIFQLGIADPDRHVRQYAAAVWLKFREDHRAEVGPFATQINAETYDEIYREYPAPPRARFTTSRGEFTVELYPADAPRSVHHFITLAESGFYNGTPVGAKDDGRTVYLGDQRADGWGVCPESIRDEINLRRIERGSLVWWVDHRHDARSVFGICLVPQPLSDFARTIFGKVVEGMDVAEQLRPLDLIEHVEIILSGPA